MRWALAIRPERLVHLVGLAHVEHVHLRKSSLDPDHGKMTLPRACVLAPSKRRQLASDSTRCVFVKRGNANAHRAFPVGVCVLRPKHSVQMSGPPSRKSC